MNIKSSPRRILIYIQKQKRLPIIKSEIKELSIQWIIKRKQLLKEQNCIICGKDAQVIHHPIEPQYYKSAKEYIEEIFLVPLCHDCHSNIHNEYWIKRYQSGKTEEEFFKENEQKSLHKQDKNIQKEKRYVAISSYCKIDLSAPCRPRKHLENEKFIDKYPSFNKPWSHEEDLILKREWLKGTTNIKIGEMLGRTKSSISSRANNLKLYKFLE